MTGTGGRAGPAEIVFDRAGKRYPGQTAPALDALDLVVPPGEICALVGPSGGGKTTALTLVNRMTELSSGDIRIGGHSIREIEPIALRRDIGYVIQQTGLFPHMSVAANISLLPRILKWSARATRDRVTELLELVGLSPAGDFADRFPTQLSGGQQQRVGIARALAVDPPVMLMDEPFGALDPITRDTMQREFLRLHARIRKTTLIVTHDVDEAILMGDRIAILRDGGTLAQHDTPDAVLRSPASDFVARFVGADRSLKRLALRTLADLPPAAVDGSPPRWPTAPAATDLRQALALVLAAGSDGLLVGDGGAPSGLVTLDALRRAGTTSDADR
ncbi:MAG TPA: ABC transporter ATP-binding protein [Pseudonocardia sp.]|jgi:osmoprotectant transport system ATP-binding protein